MSRLWNRLQAILNRPGVRFFLALLLMVGVTLSVYHNLLFPADALEKYPWSSDGWGHLMKADFLSQQIEMGNAYPELFPGWYNGVQLLRYYAPLPYYALVGVFRITGDVFIAGNWFLFLCGLFGAASFLLYRKWMGWLPAFLGGVLFLLLPDNLRVAFAEGNIPRVVATALLPLTVYFLLSVLQNEKRVYHLLCLTLLVALITLSHAMMAAIFAVCMGLFVIIYWFMARTTPAVAGKSLGGIACGVLLASWWLIPSLVGGIAEINQAAASESVARIPLIMSLNPLTRLANKEAFYLGVSLIIGIGVFLYFWRRITPMVKSWMLVGIFATLLGSTLVSGIYQFMPMSHLLWPIRFMSFGGFALVLGLAFFGAWLLETMRPRIWYLRHVAFVALAVILILDFAPSTILAAGRTVPDDLLEVSGQLSELEGWREATLDLSRFGSAPSYLVTAVGGREQVFGWAYQGCATVPIIASINSAFEEGYDAYAVDRLDRLGVDDVILLKGISISETVQTSLPNHGYQLVYDGSRVSLYHKDGVPRASELGHSILGIGDGTYNLALLFPQTEAGKSAYVDDYELDFLKQYDCVVLSRFNWHNKARAEALVTAYAGQGGKLVIDLTGSPLDVLAKEPHFLGVYGEPVSILYQAILHTDGREEPLLPFRADCLPWHSFTLQGLDVAMVTFPYAGVDGIALGYKTINGGRVTFLGLNLIYHAILTDDPVAIRLLEDELGMATESVVERRSIILEDYRAAEDGYRFSIELAKETDIVVPVAHHDGTVVEIDGVAVPTVSIDHMVSFTAPEGQHSIYITVMGVPAETIGKVITGVGILGLVPLLAGRRRLQRFLGRRS